MPLSDEEAKAVQQVAKTLQLYEPDVRALGEFFGRIIGRPAEMFGGLVGDAIAAVRIELALRFKKRFERLMREQGLTGPTRSASINVAFPIIEAASLEEDEEIQELFAQLLVNAVDVDSGIVILKSFVDVVRTMSSLEARVLAALVDTPEEFLFEGSLVVTANLPEEYLAYDDNAPPPSEQVALALSNLERNGCIRGAGTWSGGESLNFVSVTPFGFALMRACRPSK